MENTVQPQVSNGNIPTQPPPPVKSSPLPIIILSIFVVICLAAIGFLFWQNQQLMNRLTQIPNTVQNQSAQLVPSVAPVVEPTTASIPTNWKTYDNQKAGISFQYPSDWILTTGESNHEVIILTKKDDTQAKVMLPGDIQDTATYRIDISLPPNSDISIPSQSQPVTVGGKLGVKFIEGAAPSSGPSTVVLVGTDSKYEFIYSALAQVNTHTKYLNTFDQILSTFKFTNN
jgi:hypothetical protein